MLTILFIILAIIAVLYVLRLTLLRFRFRFNEKDMFMFFGLPGSGKTTVCADIVRQCLTDKRLRKCIPYCNFPVKGAFKCCRSDIGHVDFVAEGYNSAVLLLDEASTVYFKRNATNKIKDKKTGQMVNEFSNAENEFHSMHRHYHTMEVLFAQSWDGVDLRLRELSTGLFYVEPSRLRPFIKIRTITKIFTIREEDHQPCDGYEFERFSSRYVWAPRCWKMFDTYHAPELEKIDPDSWYDV